MSRHGSFDPMRRRLISTRRGRKKPLPQSSAFSAVTLLMPLYAIRIPLYYSRMMFLPATKG
ncbi:MAG: hypothetical protein IKB22_06795 [Lentisphaeria bacterium]|nr:hypothetical protein [Lentisphaeria bacterium]